MQLSLYILYGILEWHPVSDGNLDVASGRFLAIGIGF